MDFGRLCLLLGVGGGASSQRYWPEASNESNPLWDGYNRLKLSVPGTTEVQSADWIQTRQPIDTFCKYVAE